MATTDLALYRSVRKDEFPDGVIADNHAVSGVLYPSFEDKEIEIRKGGAIERRTRRADIYPFELDGQAYVKPRGGTSLFDRENVFGTKHWWCFTIPAGTTIPDSLRILHTGRNETYAAEHYQIEVAAGRMTVTAFKGALDNFARNAVEKLYRDARSGASNG